MRTASFCFSLATMYGALAMVHATAGVAHAKPPASFGAKAARYELSDNEPEAAPVPTPDVDEVPSSGIVWGDVSEDYRACDKCRAGCPESLRWLTIPSRTRYYGGYYVGGGTPLQGAGFCAGDGTWGWDYPGILFPKRIALNWTKNGRYQGGTGAYKTDGPKLKHE